jgi:hypothetical protein
VPLNLPHLATDIHHWLRNPGNCLGYVLMSSYFEHVTIRWECRNWTSVKRQMRRNQEQKCFAYGRLHTVGEGILEVVMKCLVIVAWNWQYPGCIGNIAGCFMKWKLLDYNQSWLHRSTPPFKHLVRGAEENHEEFFLRAGAPDETVTWHHF